MNRLPSKLRQTRRESGEALRAAFDSVTGHISRASIEALAGETVERLGALLATVKKPGLAWSGGKDSLVLAWLLKEMRLEMPAQQVMPEASVEWPMMQPWWVSHRPDWVQVDRLKWCSLPWYAEHPEYMFSLGADLTAAYNTAKWKMQAYWIRETGINVFLTGRRVADGNNCGPNGLYMQKSTGCLIFNPLHDWTTEEVFAAIQYFSIPLPPTYLLPDGFHINTQMWADIEMGQTLEENWRYLGQHEPEALVAAAPYFRSAAEVCSQMIGVEA